MANPPLDPDLASALAAARKKPHNYALITKGVRIRKLIVSKRKILGLGKKKAEFKGSGLYAGVCYGDGAAGMVFELVGDEVPGRELVLKDHISASTGLKMKPHYRLVSEFTAVDEAEDEAEMVATELRDLADTVNRTLRSDPKSKQALLAAVAAVKQALADGDPALARERLSELSSAVGAGPAPITAEERQQSVARGMASVERSLPGPRYEGVRELALKLVGDGGHRMDIQRMFEDPRRAPAIAAGLRNTADALAALQVEGIDLGAMTGEDFNRLLEAVVREYPGNPGEVLGVASVEMDSEALRSGQGAFLESLGIAPELVAEHLSFAGPVSGDEFGGVSLSEEAPPGMTGNRPVRHQGRVYLRVPDAGGKVVSVSEAGWQALRELGTQLDSAQRAAVGHLDSFLDPHRFTISNRTKSADAILDKCGRLCAWTQSENTPKYRGIEDIIDVSGVRVTCDPTDIGELIASMKAQGYEFLELDNKYADIRKNGAYKVMPCCVRDPASGSVFELQIASPVQVAVSDIEHNVNFKPEKIGLATTPEEQRLANGLQRTAALLETLKLTGVEPFAGIDLADPSAIALVPAIAKLLSGLER